MGYDRHGRMVDEKGRPVAPLEAFRPPPVMHDKPTLNVGPGCDDTYYLHLQCGQLTNDVGGYCPNPGASAYRAWVRLWESNLRRMATRAL